MNHTDLGRILDQIREEFGREFDALDARIRELESGKMTARQTLTLPKKDKAA